MRQIGTEHHAGRNRFKDRRNTVPGKLEGAVFHDGGVVVKTRIDAAGTDYVEIAMLGLVNVLLHVINVGVAVRARLLME